MDKTKCVFFQVNTIDKLLPLKTREVHPVSFDCNDIWNVSSSRVVDACSEGF